MNERHLQPSAPRAGKSAWAVAGALVGAVLVAASVVAFMAATLNGQKVASGEEMIDAAAIQRAMNFMMVATAALFVLVPLGAGVLIFSLIRLARIRRQTPPKLPRTVVAPIVGEPK